MRNKIYFLTASFLLLVGCVEKDMFKDIHVYPDTSLPISAVTVTDSSLFEMAGIRNKLSIGADGVLSFIDKHELMLSQNGVGIPIFGFGAQQIAVSEQLASFPIDGKFINIVDPIHIKHSISGLDGDQMIQSVSFVDGLLSVDVKGLNVVGYDPSQLKFTIPAIKVDGQPLVLTPGQRFKLDKTVVVEFAQGTVLDVYISGLIPVRSMLEGMVSLDPGRDMYSVSGFFGSKLLSTIEMSIDIPKGFADFTKNADFVSFRNPSFKLEVNNEYDVPMLLKVETLFVDGNVVNLKPGIQGQVTYIPAKGSAQLVIDNSRTVDGNELTKAITKESKNITAEISSTLNPLPQELEDPSYVAPTQNSMKITDKLVGVMNIAMPLDCVLDGVNFDKDFKADLAALDSKDVTYKQIDFTISGINEMPLDLMIIPKLMGSDGKLVDIFENPIPFPASVNNMRPTEAGFLPAVIGKENLIKLSVPEKMITQLLKAKRIYFALRASTKDAKQFIPVKIFSPSKLELQLVMGARADMVLGK